MSVLETNRSFVSVHSSDAMDRFTDFQDRSIFLPYDHVRDKVLPTILYTVFALSILYNFIHYALEVSFPKTHTAFLKRKAAYQLTNLCINAFLACVGCYHASFTLPSSASSIGDQVLGWESLYFLSSVQIGYQLWSIYVGIFVVSEQPAMICHHIALILAAFMSSFMTIGFRYWTPFFYGVVELSSVPLSVMNTFKDNPKWIERYPRLYLYIRLTFALTFLTVRWIMFVPRKYVFLQQCFLAIQASDSYWYKGYMSIVWISAAFLMCLQFYWGTLILKGLANAFLPTKKRRKQA